MRGDLSTPPLRDLPPNRLAQRREHFLAEIAQPASRWLLPRRGLLALVAAALIVVVGTASAIGGVRAFILDQGFVGLPPEGATPSTPDDGELVLRWLGRSETHARGRFAKPLVQTWVYADGRVIWSEESGHSSRPVPEGANKLATGYLEQRLTSEGVELLRSEVLGLLEGSGIPLETIPTDDEPRGYPLVDVRDGDRLLRATWEGTAIAPPEQRAALLRIDALLTDTASALPSSAWAVREIRAYVPSHYAVCIETNPPKDESQLLSLLPTRAADLLRDKSRTRLDGDVEASPKGGGPVEVQGRWVRYCSRLATEEARELAERLSGLDHDPRLARLQYRLAEAAPGARWWEGTEMWFEPYFPHGQITCSVCG
jgi:hypothetical protein